MSQVRDRRRSPGSPSGAARRTDHALGLPHHGRRRASRHGRARTALPGQHQVDLVGAGLRAPLPISSHRTGRSSVLATRREVHHRRDADGVVSPAPPAWPLATKRGHRQIGRHRPRAGSTALGGTDRGCLSAVAAVGLEVGQVQQSEQRACASTAVSSGDMAYEAFHEGAQQAPQRPCQPRAATSLASPCDDGACRHRRPAPVVGDDRHGRATSQAAAPRQDRPPARSTCPRGPRPGTFDHA
jgi:hypothetical protein